MMFASKSAFDHIFLAQVPSPSLLVSAEPLYNPLIFLLVFGFGRVLIVSWFRQQANESPLYAQAGRRMDYRVWSLSVALKEFSRQMIHAKELHAADVDKMLRKPGELASFSQSSG